MKTENSNLLIALLAGAAIGAAVVYVCTSDKKEEWLESANSLLGKAKDGFRDMKHSLKDAVDKVKCDCNVPDVVNPEIETENHQQ